MASHKPTASLDDIFSIASATVKEASAPAAETDFFSMMLGSATTKPAAQPSQGFEMDDDLMTLDVSKPNAEAREE